MELTDYLRWVSAQEKHKNVVNKVRDYKPERDSRIKRFQNERRQTRNELLDKKRNLKAVTFTPEPSEAPQKELTSKAYLRTQMLAQWKAEKQRKKMEEKKKAKPLFKVTHVPDSLPLPPPPPSSTLFKFKKEKTALQPGCTASSGPKAKKSGQTVDKLKKGSKQHCIPKRMPPSVAAKKSARTSHKLEKSSGQHSLPEPVPPSVVDEDDTYYSDEEISMKSPYARLRTPKVQKSALTDISVKENNPSPTYGTPLNTNSRTKRGSVKKRNLSASSCTSKTSSSSQINYPSPEKQLDSSKCTPVKTPLSDCQGCNKENSVPVYVSPFVTISRGKVSARKEYHIRRSTGGTLPGAEDTTNPVVGAQYFEDLLNSEVRKIQDLCDIWAQCKEEADTPEEAKDQIDVAVGQSQLLIAKKFEQFRSLIQQCRAGEGEDSPTVTCVDLHGFWDMMYLQVDNISQRFEKLKTLKENGWQEIFPAKVVRPRRQRQTKCQATSKIKAMIAAARRNKKKADVEPSQPRSDLPVTVNGRRKSFASLPVTKRVHPSRRMSSPGLVMITVTQAAKHAMTPARSILKNRECKSERRATKTVLFQDVY